MKLNIELSEIRKNYIYRQKEAARKLNISNYQLRLLCKMYGIKRWPYTKIKKIQMLLDNPKYPSDDKIRLTMELNEIKNTPVDRKNINLEEYNDNIELFLSKFDDFLSTFESNN
jgi:DNA-binding transcriptional MerR regulator